MTLAVDRFFLGTKDTDEPPDPTGWKQHGYNIDCKITQTTSTDVCTAAPEGNVWDDGPGGRDNNLGRLVLPNFGKALDVNARIGSGDGTMIVNFLNLGSEPNQVEVDAELYDGRELGHPPTFDGSDVWSTAHLRKLSGYVADSTWVSGTPVTLRLVFALESEPFFLTLHQAILTAVLVPDHAGATHGEIAGMIDKDEFNSEMRRMGHVIIPGSCGIPPEEPIDFRYAADVLMDGKQDPSRTCDGISAGIGFTMKRAQLGPPVDAEVVPLDPCPSP